MNYSQIIYTILSDYAPLTNIVDTRIYPVRINQDAQFPAISFTKQIAPIDIKNGPNKSENIQANIYIFAPADSGDLGDIIAAHVRAALDRYPNQQVNGIYIESARYMGQDEEIYVPENDIYMITQVFNIKIKYS